MRNFTVCSLGVCVLTVSVAFAQPMPGQIMVDPENPAWLVRNQDTDGDGRLDPLFFAGPGDPEEYLYMGTRQSDGTRAFGQQQDIIDKQIATGANCTYIQIIRSHGGDGVSDHNPWINSQPGTSSNSNLDSDILNQWHGWFGQMDTAGIVINLFIYDDSAEPFGGNARTVGNPEKKFVTDIVNEFKGYKNLIWTIAEEYAEANSMQNIRDLTATIRAADEYGHIIAVHQNTSASFDFAGEGILNQFSMQMPCEATTPTTAHQKVLEAVGQADGRYNVNMSESGSHGYGSRTPIRRYSWAVAMAGAYVQVLKMKVYDTKEDILRDHGRIVAFFEQTPFNRMAPNDALGMAGTDYVLADTAGDWDSYILYSVDLGSEEMGIHGLTGNLYDLLWFDPVTGQEVFLGDVAVVPGDVTFAKPAGIGSEAVVYVNRVPEPVGAILLTVGGLALLHRRRRT